MQPVLLFLLSVLLLSSCNQNKPGVVLLEMKVLNNYPSGSGSDYFENRLMIVGDDSPNLLVLDSAWKVSSEIKLLSSESVRMLKQVKADLEAATWFRDKIESGLLLLGSGSLPPHRSSGLVVQPKEGRHRTFLLDTFYDRLREAGIRELNVEGLAQLPGWYIVACRGNMNYKKNHLVFVRNRFWENQSDVDFQKALLGGNKPGKHFSGVSGLDYSYRTDRLFITASTEHTSSTSADGEIGRSYLWVVNSMNRMVNFAAINPFEEIDLEAEDPRFKGAKIESVSVISEKAGQSELVLVADNDNGETILYRILLNHKKIPKERQRNF